MDIKEDQVWNHKDGSDYVVTDVEVVKRKFIVAVIWYRRIGQEREYCRTISHFIESFTYVCEISDV